jgi:hypothetical protein
VLLLLLYIVPSLQYTVVCLYPDLSKCVQTSQFHTPQCSYLLKLFNSFTCRLLLCFTIHVGSVVDNHCLDLLFDHGFCSVFVRTSHLYWRMNEWILWSLRYLQCILHMTTIEFVLSVLSSCLIRYLSDLTLIVKKVHFNHSKLIVIIFTMRLNWIQMITKSF